MDYDYSVLEDSFKKLPTEIQVALSSVEVSAAMEDISKKNGLLLDQESIMFDITTDVLLGLMPSKEFVKNFSREAKVSNEVATAVAKDINTQIFDSLRSSMQAVEARVKANQPAEMTTKNDIGAVEQAGGFTVEKAPPSTNDSISDATPEVSENDKDSILDSIENPTPASPKKQETLTEPLMDHLLANPMASVEEKKTAPAPANLPTAASAPKKPAGPDPYKEPIQ